MFIVHTLKNNFNDNIIGSICNEYLTRYMTYRYAFKTHSRI